MKDYIRKSILLRKQLNPSKTCPFCGAAGEGKSEKDKSGKRMYYVECVHCRVRTKAYLLMSAAVKHWDSQIFDTKQKCGDWLCKKDDEGIYIECSVCQIQYGYMEEEEPPYSKYCPECGARLVQTEQNGERKISIDDQVENAERIKTEKNKKDRMEKIETYRRQELAEDFLRKIINVDDEEDETDENAQLVH